MIFKIIILIFLFIIFFALGMGVFFLLKQKPGSTQLVKALTVRITVSLFLFFLILIAFFMGWIQPHHLSF